MQTFIQAPQVTKVPLIAKGGHSALFGGPAGARTRRPAQAAQPVAPHSPKGFPVRLRGDGSLDIDHYKRLARANQREAFRIAWNSGVGSTANYVLAILRGVGLKKTTAISGDH
jgi:hypothetical protein